jgi:IS5 family transposase
MPKQPVFPGLRHAMKKKRTRREKFLAEMEAVMPWTRLLALIEPHYPKRGSRGGRPPMPMETMLRVYFLQQWYALSDPMAEEMLYDSEAMRRFAGIELGDDRIPDETTILNFRHLLEKHALTERLFVEVNKHFADQGITLRSGTLVDATIINAPSSTKNEAKARDPEMSSTKKGNDWFFGMKAHVGVDAESGIVHSLATTTAKVHDSQIWDELLHGKETSVWADKGYVSAARESCQRRVKFPQKCRSKFPHLLGSGDQPGSVIGSSVSGLGRSSPSLRRRRRSDGRIGPHVLGYEIGMTAQAVAGSFDLDDHGVVQEAVQERRGDDRIAEDLSPFGEAAVRGEDHGALLVAGVDELEEQVGATGADRQVADLVNDEQRSPRIEADLLGQPPFPLCLGQCPDQIGQGRAVDTLARLDRGNTERGRQVALSGARRPEEVQDFGPADEVELCQRRDPLPVERGLEAEVEAFERLHRQQLRRALRNVDPPGFPCRVFLAQQAVDRFDGDDLTPLELLQGVLESFEGARHLQAHQRAADAVQ